MEIGQQIEYRSYDVIRKGLILEDRGEKVLIVLKGDYKTQGRKIVINKNQIIC